MRSHIQNLTQHIEHPKQKQQVEEILWHNKDLFDSGPAIVNIHHGDHPVAYLSKKFTASQSRWSTTEQECYALICSLEKWHIYLSGTKFIWETDHQPLKQLNLKAQTNKKCERWRLKIAEYDYIVQHIKGINNAMPDYLSRSPVDDAEEDLDENIFVCSKSTQTDMESLIASSIIIAAVQTRSKTNQQTSTNNSETITTALPDLNKFFSARQSNIDSRVILREDHIIPFTLDQLRKAQHQDDQVKQIILNIKNQKKYMFKNDLLIRQTSPPVPYVPKGHFRSSILKIFHGTPANGAHFGRDRTVDKIKKRYFWPSMIKDIENHVQSCLRCAQFNPRRRKPPRLLKPIKPPEGVWQLLAMDFHGPITPVSTRGN
ncbi:unnamed protein product, partial [Didymodactylos carnosus]